MSRGLSDIWRHFCFSQPMVGARPRKDRPEDAQDSFMVKVGWQICLDGVAYPHGTTKSAEVEPHSLQQVLSRTTEDYSHFKKEASLWPGGGEQP